MASREHVLTVEDEQDERYALRAREVWEHRVEEAGTARGKSSWRSTAAGTVA